MTAGCRRLEAGAYWPEAGAGATYALSTDRFDVTIQVVSDGQVVSDDQHPSEAVLPGEEVGAVLEGSFRIEAAGETYELSRGEAIVIPPGEPRQWTCTAARGVLYRVVVTNPADPEG